MFRRRRPLLRAAAVGGAGYAIGKHAQAGREQADQDEPGAVDDQQAQQAQPPESTAMSEASLEQLRQLAQLNKEGVLTDEEFASQKQKLLQGG